MSEKGAGHDGEYVCDLSSFDIKVHERITRCKDCVFYDEVTHSCVRFDRLAGTYVSYVFDSDFCAWAEPREES